MTYDPTPDARRVDDAPTEVVRGPDTVPPADPVPTTDPTPPADGAPTTPVERPAAAPRGGRARWLAAIGGTALVVAVAIGATVLLTGEPPEADVLRWTPADSVVYAELRLDLPGSQRAALGSFLSAFPGFDDQAILDQKLGEALDRLVQGATEGRYNYRTDIDPWFAGPVAMSVGPLPAAAELETAEGRGLVLVAVDDAAAARAWMDRVAADLGASTSTETHSGVQITIVDPPAEASRKDMTGAYATVGPVLALGDVASVKAAIDTGGSSALADEPAFAAAAASVSGDRLGFFFADTKSLMDWSIAMRDQLPDGADEMPALPSFLDDISAEWVAGALRMEEDAIVIESRTPHLEAISGQPANRASSLAGLVPGNTLVLAGAHDVDDHLDRLLTLLRSDPETAKGLEEVESVAGLLGGIEGLTGWIGDLGIVVVPDGDSVAGGLVVDPSDGAAGDRLLTTLRSFITLAGSSAGITIRDETHGSATITVVTLEDVGALMDLAGGGGGSSGGSDSPVEAIELAYASTGEVVVLGSSPAFVRAVLDAPATGALSANPRFAELVERAGGEHSGLVWIDLAGGRGLFEGMLDAEERAEYETEIRPYLEQLDAVLGTTVAGGEIDASTLYITVSE